MGWPKALNESGNFLRNKSTDEAKKHECSNYETVENMSKAESPLLHRDKRWKTWCEQDVLWAPLVLTYDERWESRWDPQLQLIFPQQNETQAEKHLENGADKGLGTQIYDEINQMQNTDALKSARAM